MKIWCSGLISLLAAALLGVATAQAASYEFNMTIDEVRIHVAPDLDYNVFAFNKQVPGPLIHVKEGDTMTIHVTNRTSFSHTVHFHGFYQHGSWRSDGVPAVTQPPIKPGETFTYHIKAEKTGSLWYHCHVNVNEHVGIRGMWGPIVVDPKKPLPIEKEVTKDVIMMLSTWESAHADKFGTGATPYDVDDYFSLNAKSFPLTQPLRVKTGDVVRIRFFGAGTGIHSIHSHAHDMLITHLDGRPVSDPHWVDTFLIGPGQRVDVIMRMDHKEGRFIFHDHVDKRLTGRGKYPGGPITIIEYAGTPMDDWYIWKDKKYDPDFFFGESMKKGYGMFTQKEFQGVPISRRHHHQE